MNKYLVVYHAPLSYHEKVKEMKPEEKMAEMGKWHEWSENCGDAMVDMGAPLKGGMKVMKSSNKTGTREVVGYSMIQAKSMDAAMEIMKSHPHLLQDNSCEIEIHEATPMPGQQ